MTVWNKSTVCLRNTGTLAGQGLEKRNPGSLVRSISTHSATVHTTYLCDKTSCFFSMPLPKGTLLEQPTLYEDDVNTPENLQRYTQFYFCHLPSETQHLSVYSPTLIFSFFVCLCRTLEREALRKQYVSPPVPTEGCPLVYPDTGQPWIGRRIDYILFRETSISKHCRTVCGSTCVYSFLSPILSCLLQCHLSA